MGLGFAARGAVVQQPVFWRLWPDEAKADFTVSRGCSSVGFVGECAIFVRTGRCFPVLIDVSGTFPVGQGQFTAFQRFPVNRTML